LWGVIIVTATETIGHRRVLCRDQLADIRIDARAARVGRLNKWFVPKEAMAAGVTIVDVLTDEDDIDNAVVNGGVQLYRQLVRKDAPDKVGG